MSARVFLTDSFRDSPFVDSLCEFLGESLDAALFDLWLGGDAKEAQPDIIVTTPREESESLSRLGAPIICLSDQPTGQWADGVEDVIHPHDFGLLIASLRVLHQQRQIARLLDSYADMAHKNLLQKAALMPEFSSASGKVLVYADQEDVDALSAALDGQHDIYQNELDRPDSIPDLIIVKDDMNVFVQLSAQPDREIPVMFWSADRIKIIRALNADASGYMMALSSCVPRIERQIQNSRRRARLKQDLGLTFDLAVRDELTGLYNRRFMIAHLPEVIKNVMKQEKKRLAVLLLDIDRFKNINDYWGHDTGDAILRRAAALFAEVLRKDDEIYRIGGEEFLAVLPNVGMKEAYAIAQRLCALIDDTHFVVGEAVVPVTISAGVGLFQPGERVQNLLKRADEALYRAKNLGRNQAA